MHHNQAKTKIFTQGMVANLATVIYILIYSSVEGYVSNFGSSL